VGDAKDDNAGFHRPQAAGTGSDNVNHDAIDVYLPFPIIPQRVGSLLGGIKPDHYWYAIFYSWRLGWSAAGKG
jgi:hypothetical protein